MSKEKNPCWKGYIQLGMKKKDGKESPNCVPEKKKCKACLNFKEWLIEEDKEEKKPFKGFKKGVNHPEGGLSRSEAKKKGIRAGIDTKREIEKKGGVKNISDKTKARRKSFCSRMLGHKKKNTSAKTANDPNSKINAALRVWKC